MTVGKTEDRLDFFRRHTASLVGDTVVEAKLDGT
jgi:hypothetical protein